MTATPRARKTATPCPRCRLHPLRCICAVIPRLHTRSRLVVIAHARELKRTTSTGRLAVEALVNSALHVRGRPGARSDFSGLLSPDYESVVLYPSEAALDINGFVQGLEKPVQLIVSDGNWRQAGKLNTRHPELAHLPRVKIGSANSASHHLRREHLINGFSTLEAIARAMTIIEGEAVGRSLQDLYQAKLNATLMGRGLIPHLNVE